MKRFLPFQPTPHWAGWFGFEIIGRSSSNKDVLDWMTEQPQYVLVEHPVDLEATARQTDVFVVTERYFMTRCQNLAFEFKMRWC